MSTDSSRGDPLRSAISTIFLAGGTAGAIDFVYATTQTVIKGLSALRPWMGVAAGLFGVKTVVHIGAVMALVGTFLHFFITIVAAAIYYAVATRQSWLVRNALLSGVGFGTAFFLVMNYIILPLSAFGRPLYVGPSGIAIALVSHIVIIGLPVALITSWGIRKRQSRQTSPAFG